MADNASYYGFRFHSTRTGSGNPTIVPKFAATGYNGQPDGATSTDMNIGDPVKLVSDGSVALAAAGDAVFGVIESFGPYWDGYKMVPTRRLPNANAWGTNIERRCVIHVVPVSGHVFEVDADDAVTATTQATYEALVGENADHAYSASSTTGKANPRLDISDHKTGTAQWRIVGISQTAANQDFSGNYVKLLVVANEVNEAPYVTTGV